MLLIILGQTTSTYAGSTGVGSTFTLKVGLNPLGIAFNPKTGTLYVAIAGATLNGTVAVIDASNRIVLKNVSTPTIRSGVIHKLVSVDVNPISNLVYVSDAAQQAVFVIDGNTNMVNATIVLDGEPAGIGVDSETGKSYVAIQSSNVVDVIDGKELKVIGTIVVESPYTVAVDSVTNRIYVSGDKGVSIIDGTTERVVGTLPLGRIFGITVNPASDKVYLTDRLENNGTVYVVEGSSNDVTAMIHLCCNLWGVATDASRDRVYVSDDYLSTVAVIDGQSNKLTDSITVGSLPAYIAVNQADGVAYVANWGDTTVSVLEPGVIGSPSHGFGVQPYVIVLFGGLAASILVMSYVLSRKRKDSDEQNYYHT